MWFFYLLHMHARSASLANDSHIRKTTDKGLLKIAGIYEMS